MGGGVTGCAMLYNLAKRGVKCVLFEKVLLENRGIGGFTLENDRRSRRFQVFILPGMSGDHPHHDNG